MKYAAILLAAVMLGIAIWASVSRLDPADNAAPKHSTPRIKVTGNADRKPIPNAPADVFPRKQRSQPAPAATGTVEGTVIYDPDPARPWRYGRYYVRDPKDGALAEAVVALDRLHYKAGDEREPQTAVMDQKNFQFVPETLAIRAGDRVKFLNSDPVTHNVYSRSPLHSFDITLQGQVQESVETFDRAGGIRQPVWLGCQFHGSMRAWIYVFDHPWFAVTGPDGRFRLENVPVGKYRLQMSHPAGELRFSRQIRVELDRTVSVEIRVSPDDRVTSDR